jgi:hypothetical protein
MTEQVRQQAHPVKMVTRTRVEEEEAAAAQLYKLQQQDNPVERGERMAVAVAVAV